MPDLDELKTLLAESQRVNEERHRELLETEFERKRLATQAAEDAKRSEAHALRRAAAVEQLLARSGQVYEAIERQTSLLVKLLSQMPVSDAVLEVAEEMRRGNRLIVDTQDLILEALRLSLSAQLSGKKADRDQVIDLLARIDKISLHKRLEITHINLNTLLERKSKYAGDTPPALINQIEDVRQEIAEIEAVLREITSDE